ncbi:hypothetical protein DSCA_41430 [Desulfosarcina alkanivorans]|uniref:Uncharacterized protein n=1 Tax=Desulfosarcina alkanivorans TaxID=571177 RepID=A0A5K7YP96_9BACT|nr:hypothetical protein [Desulfosarcina alkanivorans]BBO70213.1 hypothetical protein DSCA_41430 [Desulfosarcina alkanivorans]
MKPRPLLSCPLKNGLTLLCLDQSKKIAADRWYVCIGVQIAIPVDIKWFANHPVEQDMFHEMRRELGQEVLFEQLKERNFVSDLVKDQVVKEICDSVEEMGSRYFSHHDFAAKYILKRYADQHRRR